MPRKLALKRLTASDLTLFKWHFQNRPAGKQKAFNLDTNVLVGQLYPQLGEPSPVPQPRYPLDLYLYGPGLAQAYNLQRKILKQQKNWRLNGELIDDPEGSPGLYNALEAGDFALFEFAGDVVPTTAKVVLIANQLPADASLYAELFRRFPDGSMRVVDDAFIHDLLAVTSPPAGHPLYDWAETSFLEDAVLGGAVGAEAIYARRGSRGVSPDDFRRSRQSAEATGVAGEELLNAWLDRQQQARRIQAFEWTSSTNAVAPYDFRITDSANVVRVIDAKSTIGGFGNPIHLSLMELRVAVRGPEPYDIFRLYEVTEDGAKMRIARDIGPSLRDILTALLAVPDGVSVDSISILPDVLDFSQEVFDLGALEAEL